MSAPAAQTLPTKEQGLFRQLVKYYENKQYKKAIKAADAILKKFPDHGETLAMKGLTLNYQDKKEESYELVRKGLKCDLKSHVCWHVYGLLYRSDREYREAIKCYLNALRIDKDNVQILRDLANLQVQMRDLQGFVETRHQLLTLKSGNRNNWISFAVAHHISGNHAMAVQILESYEKTQDYVPSSEAYEHSEMLMYKARVLMEAGRLQEALLCMETNRDKIRDKWAYAEQRAALLLQLGKLPAAEAAYRDQLALNPDHYKMHEGLQAALGLRSSEGQPLTQQQHDSLAALYTALREQYPRSSACRRIPLDFLQGEEFRAALEPYLRTYLRKGIPSLFVDLRPLYTDAAKVAVIQEVMEGYSAALNATGSFPLASEGAEPEPAETPVWALLYLAQHYDHLGQSVKALAAVDEAMSRAPSQITEVYSIKSEVLKRAGAPEAAAHLAEAARRMDLSDRYLNSMAVRALLDAGRPETADLTAALFVRDGDQPAYATLYDMQHMWYEVAAGDTHWRKHDLGRALKKYVAVTKHFEDIHEDQFDFHGYCMRKMTLRAYIDMLRMEDRLYANEYFLLAACGAVRCYLALYDKPQASDAAADEEALLASMSAEDRKKYKLKKKKEEKQRAKAEEEKAAAEEAARAAREAAKAQPGDKKKNQPGPVKEKDPDPDGAKLAAADPLAEATKLVCMLKEHAKQEARTHLAAFEVYSRKGRLLLALSAVQRASSAAGASDPEVHVALVKLAQLLGGSPSSSGAKKGGQEASAASSSSPVVVEVLEQGLKELLGGKTVQAYAAAWQGENASKSLRHRAAAATASVLLDGGSKGAALSLLLSGDLAADKADHASCVQIYEALSSPAHPLSDAEAAASFKGKAALVFPCSEYFEGAQPAKYEKFEFDNLVEAFGKLAF